jgi:fatty acid desaturase
MFFCCNIFVERDFEPPAKLEKAMRMTTLLALYGGPDQLMPITSGLAAIFAFLLIFWNKVLVAVGKFLNLFRASSQSTPTSANESLDTPKPERAKESEPEVS